MQIPQGLYSLCQWKYKVLPNLFHDMKQSRFNVHSCFHKLRHQKVLIAAESVGHGIKCWLILVFQNQYLHLIEIEMQKKKKMLKMNI